MEQDLFSLYKRNNGIYYYVFYDEFGRRIFRTTGTDSKKKALEFCRKLQSENSLLTNGKKKYLTFKQYAKDFWNYDTCVLIQDILLRGGQYSRQHAKNYQSVLDRILMPFWGNKFLAEITTGMIQRWLMDLKRSAKNTDGQPLSNKTLNDYLLCLRLILEQARLDGEIEINPAKEAKPFINQSKPHGVFTSEQINRLLSHPWLNMAVYAACLLSARTGMRQGEVRALTMEQINFDEKYIRVNASYNDKDGRKSTKSGHSRIVPVDDETLNLLRDIAPSTSGLVFTTNGRTPCSPNFLNEELDRQFSLKRIPKVDEEGLKLSFHSFRYYFNSRLVIANFSGEKIRSVIGHESSKMTDHYTRLTSSDMDFVREIQEKIG